MSQPDDAHLRQAQYMGTTLTLAVTTTTARKHVIPGGLYMIFADADVYFKQGGVTVVATTADYILKSNVYLPLWCVHAADEYVAAITATGTANLLFMPVTP